MRLSTERAGTVAVFIVTGMGPHQCCFLNQSLLTSIAVPGEKGFKVVRHTLSSHKLSARLRVKDPYANTPQPVLPVIFVCEN